ncbi:MAG: hypothetical protein QGH15_23055 [Kiritimatiellia bacterium]|jgi:hypothetical protein|nr:hypothetical protein [Kiritimatiellia bacterium]
MKNATLVLMTIVTACCLIVPRDASAALAAESVRGVYELPDPLPATIDTEILSMSLTPRSSIYIFGGNSFQVDSFFDVFTELSVAADPPTQTFQVDSFFDVFTELSIDPPGAPPAPGAPGTFDTEIVALSLSGSVSMGVTPRLAGPDRTGSWD